MPCRRRSSTCASPASRPSGSASRWRSCRPTRRRSLRSALPDSEVKNALFVLERLRAKKRPDELAMLRKASELVVDSMKAVIAKTGPGMTKQEQFETLRREEVNRGLTFEYLLLTAGTSLNRAPSGYKFAKGDIMSLEFGRQLSRLHRRPLPHGHHRRAGCGAGGPAGRDRDDPARRHEADQGRRHGLGDLRRRRSAGARNRRTPSTCTSWRTAWASSATRRRG